MQPELEAGLEADRTLEANQSDPALASASQAGRALHERA
jgi:hypothetical protein